MDVGFSLLTVGFSLLDIGFSLLSVSSRRDAWFWNIGFSLLDIGFSLLGIGFSLLGIGFSLFDRGLRPWISGFTSQIDAKSRVLGSRFFDIHVGAIDFAETVVKKCVVLWILDLEPRFLMSILKLGLASRV